MTIISVPKPPSFWDNVKDIPFQIGLSIFAMYSGVSGLFHFGSSNLIFVAAIKAAWIYNVIFILAGLFSIIGVCGRKTGVEAAGLLLIITSFILRVMAIVAIAGWDPAAHNILAMSIVFISASTVRLSQILKYNNAMTEFDK